VPAWDGMVIAAVTAGFAHVNVAPVLLPTHSITKRPFARTRWRRRTATLRGPGAGSRGGRRLEPCGGVPRRHRRRRHALRLRRLQPDHELGGYDMELMNYALFTPLVQYDENLEVRPYLAESWEMQDDTAIVFRLRQDVRWHDGQPVTAHDVEFTFNLAKNPERRRSSARRSCRSRECARRGRLHDRRSASCGRTRRRSRTSGGRRRRGTCCRTSRRPSCATRRSTASRGQRPVPLRRMARERAAHAGAQPGLPGGARRAGGGGRRRVPRHSGGVDDADGAADRQHPRGHPADCPTRCGRSATTRTRTCSRTPAAPSTTSAGTTRARRSTMPACAAPWRTRSTGRRSSTRCSTARARWRRARSRRGTAPPGEIEPLPFDPDAAGQLLEQAGWTGTATASARTRRASGCHSRC
jgi:hypothetical protein